MLKCFVNCQVAVKKFGSRKTCIAVGKVRMSQVPTALLKI